MPPTEEKGLIKINSARCEGECAVASRLRDFPNELAKVVKLLKPERGREGSRRYQALRHIKRKPKAGVSEGQCRNFGDAVFVILAPSDTFILTTNQRDHEQLAKVLGKKVTTPQALDET